MDKPWIQLIQLIVRNEAYGWHFQYLTVIGLSLATLTFVVGLLADLTLSARLFLLKNILSLCSAPMEVLISILYWGLRLVSLLCLYLGSNILTRQVDERLVVPDWAVIPLHAGTFPFYKGVGCEVSDKTRHQLPRYPVNRAINRPAVLLSPVDRHHRTSSRPVQSDRHWILVLG